MNQNNMRKEYDFKNARRAKDVPHLARLQSEAAGKTRITIMLDNAVLESFRARAEQTGAGYQTLINAALRSYLTEDALTEESLRRVLREELGNYKG
jgi:uncharacterized protein (DUF4415 family)